MSKVLSRKKDPRLHIEIKGNCLILDLNLPKKWALLLLLMQIIKNLPEWWAVFHAELPVVGK
jgi:hypothetical protein